MIQVSKLPLWLKVAVPSVLVAVVLCNLTGRPNNAPNFAADSLTTTRAAYAADTTRLLQVIVGLQVSEDVAQDSTRAARRLQAVAERRLATQVLAAAAATQEVVVADAGLDSAAMIRTRDQVIAHQGAALAEAATALAASGAAFDRLTEAYTAATTRADSAEAGWARTRQRLGLAEAALAFEQKRTSCHWNLVLKQVQCPSRGAIALLSATVAMITTVAVVTAP